MRLCPLYQGVYNQISAAFHRQYVFTNLLHRNMGLAKGMAHAWMRVIREGFLAKQRMAHLSKKQWNYLRKKAYEQQHG